MSTKSTTSGLLAILFTASMALVAAMGMAKTMASQMQQGCTSVSSIRSDKLPPRVAPALTDYEQHLLGDVRPCPAAKD